MTATAPSPRTGFLHRFHCARNGHYWERQLAGDREGALWVCVRCGKHGDGVPLVDAGRTAYHTAPARDLPVPEAPPIEDENAGWTAPMSDDNEEVDDVVHAADVPRPHATGPGREPVAEPEDRRSAPSATPTVMAVAVVTLAVAGGAAYLAFRRRRRHR